MKSLSGGTPYSIMFGPDICGFSTKKVHVILNYKGENYLITRDIECKTDDITHVYTLVLKSDNTYEVLIDTESVQTGSLHDDWKMLKPRKISVRLSAVTRSTLAVSNFVYISPSPIKKKICQVQ
jgi:calreticulin